MTTTSPDESKEVTFQLYYCSRIAIIQPVAHVWLPKKKGLQPGPKRNARLCCACMVGLRCGHVLTRFVFSNRSPIGICIDDTPKRGLRVLTVFFYLTEAGHRATHLRVETRDIAWPDHRNVRSGASPIQCLHLVRCLHLGRSPKAVGRLRWRGKYSNEIAVIVWNPLNPWKEPRDWMELVFLVRMRMNWFGSWRFLRSC